MRYIRSVEPVGRKQAQCIMVDHPSRLYVTDDYIVTHNTYAMVASAIESRRLGVSAKPAAVVPNHMLEQFARDMQARSGHLILCGVRPQLTPVLRHFGLIELIGKENYFETTFGMFASAKSALKRARQLIGSSIDVTSIKDKLEDEPWVYEI